MQTNPPTLTGQQTQSLIEQMLERPMQSVSKEDMTLMCVLLFKSGIKYPEAVQQFKKRFITNVLIWTKLNQCKAAEILCMHRNTLGRTISELGIDLEELRREAGQKKRVTSVVNPNSHERRA